MSTRYVVPSTVEFNDAAPAADRERVERAILNGIRHAIADAGGAVGAVVSGAAQPLPPGERFASERVRGERAYALPSYDKDGELESVGLDNDLTASVGSSLGDTIHRAGMGSLPIIRLEGNEFLYSHAGAYVETTSAGRAFQWGLNLFGGTGFAVLQQHGRRGDHFVVVGFEDSVTVHTLGDRTGAAKTQIETDAGVSYAGKLGELMPLADFTIVAAVTADKAPVASLVRGAAWYPRRVEEAMRVGALDPDDVRAAARLLLGTSAAQGLDEDARAQLARMDRTLFAHMPWEQRARYLKLLIAGYTGEDEGKAIIEIFRATTRETERDAIFGVLREWELDRRLFNDLSSGQAFELLQVFGEQRGGGPIDTRFFLALCGELITAAADPRHLAQGIEDWVISTGQGIWFMLSSPGEVIGALPSLGRFIVLIQRAQLGDPEALATIRQLVVQVGRSLANATRGASYVEQLGRPYSARGSMSAVVAGDLIGRVQYAMLLEVLTWFVGFGELKAVMTSVRSGEAAEKLIALLGRLGRFARGVKAVEAVEEAARLERTLLALGKLAEFSEQARAARLVEHLDDQHLELLAHVAERATLPEGATADVLALALRGDRALTRQADALSSALRLLGRFEEKLGGHIGPEAAAGIRHMMQNAPWSFEQGMRLAERIPAEHAEQFLTALRNVGPREFRLWDLGAFEGIAQRPRAIRFLAEAGGEVYGTVFDHAGESWPSFERFIEGLERRKGELNDPSRYQRLLDRLGTRDPEAFREALGARLRSLASKGPSAESSSLITRAVGDSGEALAALEPEAQKAARLAADVNPELTRRAVMAEYDELHDRTIERLEGLLSDSGMSKPEIERTLGALDELNTEQNALRQRRQIEEMMKRVQELDDPEAVARAINQRVDELTRRAGELRQAKPEAARRLDREAGRLRGLAQGSGRLTDAQAFQNEVKASEFLMRGVQGGEDQLRQLWVRYWGRRPRPKGTFAEYAKGIMTKHYVGMLGEYEVAFRKGEQLILLKAPDGLVTLPGTDLVAIERASGDVLLIDNKALRAQEEVEKVDALTRNLRKNLRTDLNSFAQASGDGRLPSQLDGALQRLQKASGEIDAKYGKLTREAFQDKAVQADVTAILKRNGVRRVVSNAGGEVRGLSKELEEIGIELMELNL